MNAGPPAPPTAADPVIGLSYRVARPGSLAIVCGVEGRAAGPHFVQDFPPSSPPVGGKPAAGALKCSCEQVVESDRPTLMGDKARITILTYGSRGDVEPFVALGVGLRRAGHSVRLAAPAPFASLIQTNGLDFEPIEGDPDELTQALADRAGLSWPRMIVRMMQHVRPLAQAAFRAAESAVHDADLIVHSFLMTDAGHTLARSKGVPDVSAQFFPVFLSTSVFPAVGFPDLPLGALYRRSTHALGTGVFRHGGRLLYRTVRASASDLPDLAPWPFGGSKETATPILLAYSSNVLARPPEWPEWAHVTGYWRLRLQPGWAPPDPVVHFLESGPPPIYFGPGSVRTAKLRSLLSSAITVLRTCGQRIFLGVPAEALSPDLDGTDVYAAEGIPHAWLFPRMRYILHHGGAGTTGAAATAGVPSTAIPFSADQAFWARQIHRLGVGPAAPPGQRLTPGRLEDILRDALVNPTYGRRASLLGEQLRREDGVASAIQIIHSQLGIP
jgi:sterol 3beta-glucosyltransferase